MANITLTGLFKDSLEGILPAICDRLYETALVNNDSEAAGTPPEPKKQMLNRDFDIDLLLSPLDVQPPTKPIEPEFTCSKNWLKNVGVEIDAQLTSFDTPSGSICVPPMAVVRCSRGGKTRALYEIANWMKEPSSTREPVAVIYVSFNDFSSLHNNEQDDLLQALCQRVAFAALKKPPLDEEDMATSFGAFK